jgi:hypothetical protein
MHTQKLWQVVPEGGQRANQRPKESGTQIWDLNSGVLTLCLGLVSAIVTASTTSQAWLSLGLVTWDKGLGGYLWRVHAGGWDWEQARGAKTQSQPCPLVWPGQVAASDLGGQHQSGHVWACQPHDFGYSAEMCLQLWQQLSGVSLFQGHWNLGMVLREEVREGGLSRDTRGAFLEDVAQNWLWRTGDWRFELSFQAGEIVRVKTRECGEQSMCEGNEEALWKWGRKGRQWLGL